MQHAAVLARLANSVGVAEWSRDVVTRVLRAEETGVFVGRQGVPYPLRVTTDTAGAQRLSMAILPMSPGARARVHFHDGIETIVYLVDGECTVYHGERLEHRAVMYAGECMYLPAGVPHAPCNESGARCTWVVAHAAGDDQQGIVLLPELDALLASR